MQQLIYSVEIIQDNLNITFFEIISYEYYIVFSKSELMNRVGSSWN